MLKKKITSLVLVLMLLMGTVVMLDSQAHAGWWPFGSDDEDSKSEVVNIDYWNPFGGGDAKFMEQMVKKFNETHPKINVKSTRLEFSEYYTKLKTATASDNGPDIAISHITRLPEMVNEGLAVSVDELATETDISWSEFNQNIENDTVINNKHYAVPLDTHPQVMYYNKEYLAEADLLDENGKPIIEEGPEGFINFLTRLKENSSAKYPMSNWTKLSADGHFRLWLGLYSQLNGETIISDGEVSLDKEKAIKAIKYMNEIYNKDLAPLHSEYMESVNVFRNKKAATLITGVWITGTLESTEDLDLGVVPVPKIFDRQATWANSHTLILPYSSNADERKQKAALTFAKWVTDNGELWAKAGHIPSKNSIKNKQEFKEMPYRTDYVEAANYASFNKAGVDAPGVKDKMVTALSGVWKGDYSAEEGVNKAVEQLERLLSR